jgi:hypothetical protein
MLYAWGFERVGVVASDMYFLDPNPSAGQEGAERGVRVEVRLLDRPPLTGSIYAAQPIVIDRPVWRADLFESVAGPPGSRDRIHHHPRFRGWEPGGRQYDPALSEDPIGWLVNQLADLPELLAGAQLEDSEIGPDDARELATAAPEIAQVVATLLDRVRVGELATAPAEIPQTSRAPPRNGGPVGVRSSWL